MTNTEMNTANSGVNEKIAVCITAQSNSQRLIDVGAQTAAKCDGELHILHVQKGESVFNRKDSWKLLERLFSYGGECGGMIHAFCDDDIPQCIARFVAEEGITRVVMGELPKQTKKQLAKSGKENQFQNILNSLPNGVELMIVPRQETVVAQEKQRKKVAKGKLCLIPLR